MLSISPSISPIATAVAWKWVLSPHAEVRAQQRGVDRNVLECLLTYGRRDFDHCGCEIVYFDNASLEDLAKYESIQLWLKAVQSRCVYAVVNSDGLVVTTGHRYRRIQRDKSLSSYRTGRTRSPLRRFHFQ